MVSDFIALPHKDEILAALRERAPAAAAREDLCETIAERLEGRTYDGAALTFILMEILYDHQEEGGAEVPDLLGACVVALTRNEELGRSATEAFGEIRDYVGL